MCTTAFLYFKAAHAVALIAMYAADSSLLSFEYVKF